MVGKEIKDIILKTLVRTFSGVLVKFSDVNEHMFVVIVLEEEDLDQLIL